MEINTNKMSSTKIKKTFLDNIIINVLENDWVGMDFISGKLWEPHIIQFLKYELTTMSNFIDVGSNYGYISIRASKLCNRVFSFEPQLFMYNLSKISISDNAITNIEVSNFALGDETKEINLSKIDYSGEGIHVGEVSVGYSTDIGEIAKIIKLDDIFNDTVDIIKIDVQGYEKFVLNGSKEIIKKNTPTLIVEIESHQLNKFNYSSEQLLNFIRNLDYYIFFLDYHYPSDFVCVHNSKLNSFIKKNQNFIKPLIENNSLNNCLLYGVNQMISYSEEIKYNTYRI